MSLPPNPYAGGMPGKRTPEMPPNPYQGGMPGQRSPWGRSSPQHYSPFPSPRRHNQSQSSPSNQWHGIQARGSPRYTSPHTPNYSPIPHQPCFTTPYSNNRGSDNRGRQSMEGEFTPYGEKRQGQKSFHKDRRYSGNTGGRGGHKRDSDVPIERYFKEEMLQNPWAELEKEDPTLT